MSDKISLSQQKLDLDEVRIALQKKKAELDYRVQVLTRGMEAINIGEDMMESDSILAQEVRNIMRNPLNGF